MTQADSTSVLRMSLDSKPILSGPGPVTVSTPLPDGWASFCSKPDKDNAPHWYATAPYDVDSLQQEFGPDAWELAHTVSAKSWSALHVAVASQILLYETLTAGRE